MKSVFSRISSFLKNNKLVSIMLLVVVGAAVVLSNVFGELTPIKSIEIFSEKLDYTKKEPGAWRITKSAKWSSRGIAEITIDVDTIRKSKSKYTDVIFVLDTSDSMEGDRISKAKDGVRELISNLLVEEKNHAALISFDMTSTIHSGLTNNKSELISKVNSLAVTGNTNYYQALINIDSILKTYTKEDDREMVVLFLTDGYPNEDTPNEVGFFNYLKSTYPYATFNAIQYEMGSSILEPIKKISDYQYVASMNNLNNVLSDVAIPAFNYDEFTITDFINRDAFYIDRETDIRAESGEIEFDRDNQKIIWKVDGLKSGRSSKLTIKARLKTELIDKNGIYSTNNQEEVISLLAGVNESITSLNTPIISTYYKVSYDINIPDGCTIKGIIPNEQRYSVYSTIKISSNELSCDGYQFKGWDIITKEAEAINDDYFIMPESDVTIRGKWSTFSLSQSMIGTVGESLTLYKQIKNDVNDSTKFVKKYTGATDTFTGKQDIYYYHGKATNNNVSFAGYCWKIIRTTDTGGVKLLYNGVPDARGACNNIGASAALTKEQMNTSNEIIAFNSNFSSLADVGYMYNIRYTYNSKSLSSSYKYGNSFIWDGTNYTLTDTVDSTGIPSDINTHHYTCWNTTGICNKLNYIYYISGSTPYYIILSDGKGVEEALNEMLYNDDVNTNNSTIKVAIDYWYENNMTEFTPYLEDAVWCNDRNISNQSTNGWNPNGGSTSTYLYFKPPSDRVNLTCKNRLDRFTVNKENGNGALTYPVGLIDVAEIYLAYNDSYSPSSPHAIGNNYWGLTPYDFYDIGYAYGSLVNSLGSANYYAVYYTAGVRPSVSLRTGIEYSTGDGSSTSPYVITTD